MFPNLESERLVMRELVEDDAQGILNCFSNEDVLRFYGQNPLTDVEQVKKIIKNFAANYKQKQGIKWGIERKGTEGIIGTIGFHDWSSEHRRAEIAYALLPEHWGKGYATEAVSEVISYGFRELNLTRIGAVVFTENHASNKLLTKLGFEQEGVLRNYMYQYNVPYDTNVYALIPEKS
ncbi:GNAT family N-acetyltransferase [Bacillus solimangrovi]|uniref:GNAT family N-acetyltransferase n=1 Tax=Bacillus solimangrovi TaxID=1305675 RepID=A0A1E5LG73_9BACI|nr:GNAT family N-acetyltransferase [Bacillus solimangrovi]OEH93056.1 GNAT family N-acetyltransferase [Bacillus solimangrovi]